MFALDLWDGPIMLLGEIALSIALIAGIMFAVRLANTRSTRPGMSDPAIPEMHEPAENHLGREGGRPAPAEPTIDSAPGGKMDHST